MIELVRDFVNTLHMDPNGDDELLVSPAALGGWLDEQGLADGAGASAADLVRALELREALRTLLLVNNGVEVDTAAARDVLDAAARRARLEVRFDDGGSALVPAAAGAPAGLGRIVAAAHTAMVDGSWRRLKACRAEDCRWAFVDHARNQSRAWCSMRSCGNREKARRFRARQAPATAAPPANAPR